MGRALDQGQNNIESPNIEWSLLNLHQSQSLRPTSADSKVWGILALGRLLVVIWRASRKHFANSILHDEQLAPLKCKLLKQALNIGVLRLEST